MNEEQTRSSVGENGAWEKENTLGRGAPSESETNGGGAKEALAQEIKLTPEQEARFWAKVDKSAGPDSCWPWAAGKFKQGYGSFRAGDKMLKAHRIAWTLTQSQIPHGLWACHRCDNRPCCNPVHLFLGTDKDNARDRENKGRGNQPKGDRSGSRLHPESRPRGEAHYEAKLTACKVVEIRALYAAGGTSQRRLAAQFGVDKSVIYRVINRKTWKHIP